MSFLEMVPCPGCGLTMSVYERGSLSPEIVESLRKEALDHAEEHVRRVDAYVELGRRPPTAEQQEELKTAGRDLLLPGNPLRDRVRGALMVLEAYHARSLNCAVDRDTHLAHPEFHEFIALGDLERLFEADVAAHLRERYGTATSPDFNVDTGRWEPRR
jgi:hypothetical protein